MESMENRNWKDLEKRDPKPPTISSGAKSISGSAADQQFFVSFGLIMSCRLGDVERIRASIQALGGRVVFQTVSNGDLFLFREAQVEKAFSGDLSALAEAHKRKERRVMK
jgi:hypothetical protein